MYFEYGEKELSYLRQKDKRLCEVIDRIGPIERTVDTDLFSSVVHHIIGQQISTKAQATIWQRMQVVLGEVNAETILAAGVPKLPSGPRRDPQSKWHRPEPPSDSHLRLSAPVPPLWAPPS